MSYLNKLEIRGIRSFHPDQPAVIEFFKPLTVIVGANGCGKTTIIECLKYATTSSLPAPGAMWVHDPQIAGEAEVKASVKLKFMTGGGKQYLTTQVVKVRRTAGRKGSAGKKQFSTLDMVLTFLDQAKQTKHNLGGKCATLAEAVPKLLGVSKPILENVFFCHQEDSNWPMGTARELQDKFNAIFMVSKYTKAMQNIKEEIKFRKAAKNEVALSEAKLVEQVDQVKKWRKQRQKHQSELDEILEEQEKLAADLQEKQSDLAKARGVAKEQTELVQKRNGLQIRLEHEQEALANARRDQLTTTKPKGFGQNLTKADLQELAKKTQQEVEGDGDLGAKEEQLERLQQELAAVERELQKHATALGQKTEQVQQHDRLRKDLENCTEEILQKYSIDSTDAGDPSDFEAALLRKIEEAKTALAESRAERAKAQAQIEQELVQVRSKIATSEAHSEALKKEHERLELEIHSLFAGGSGSAPQRARRSSRSSSSSGGSSGGGSSGGGLEPPARLREKLKAAEGDLARVTREVADLDFESTKTRLQAELEAAAETTRDLESNANRLDALLIRGQGQSQLQAMEDAVRKGEEKIEFLVSRLRPKLKDVGIQDCSPEELQEKFDDRVGVLKAKADEARRVQQRQRDLKNAAENSKKRCDADLAALRRKKGEEVEKLRGAVATLRRYKAAQGQEVAHFDRVYGELKTRLADLRKRMSGAAEDKMLQARLLCNMVESTHEKGQCRLCKRKLEPQDKRTATALRKVKEKAEQILSQAQSDIDSVAAAAPNELEQIEHDFDLLDGLKAHHARLNQIDTVDIPERETALKQAKDELATALEDFQSATVALDNTTSEVRTLEAFSSSVSEITFSVKGLRTSKKEFHRARLAESAVADQGTPSTASLKEERDSVQASLTQARKRHGEALHRMESLRSKHDRLQSDSFSFKGAVLKLREQLSEADAAEKKRTTNLARVAAIDEELTKEEYDLSDRRQARAELERSLREFKTRAADMDKREQGVINSMTQAAARFHDKKQAVDSIEGRSDAELEELQHVIDSCKQRRSRCKKEITDISNELDQLRQLLEGKKSYQAAISADIRVRVALEKVSAIKTDLLDVEEGLDSYATAADIQKAVKKLEKSCDKRQTAHTMLEGRAEEKKSAIKYLNRDLRQHQSKEEELSRCKIDLKTLECVIHDLAVFRKAVEDSLMKYHAFNIKRINAVIKDLWNKTYKGNDITSIEIKADATASARSVSSFQYSLVMKKGNAEIDMRQRCSAGQKVLASLVIRLALAEVYGMKCGVMALDEPTTNLDKRHKESLARALADIIETRSRDHSNFQLILITHDREFVNVLQQFQAQGGHRGEYYYTVERHRVDGVYRSRIKQESYV